MIKNKKNGYMTILTIYSRSLKLIGENAGSKICRKILFPPPPPKLKAIKLFFFPKIIYEPSAMVNKASFFNDSFHIMLFKPFLRKFVFS